MKRVSSIIVFLLFSIAIITIGCSEKTPERDFVIPADKPAVAFTIGWYVPVNILSQIVGEGFTPKMVNDNNEAEIMLRIVKGSDHLGDRADAGEIKMAQLIIPVKKPASLAIDDGTSIQDADVCPINIIEKGPWLGNRLDSLGFATYTGEISLEVKQDDQKYLVNAKIKTMNGSIKISGMFDQAGQQIEKTVANFMPGSSKAQYYYGEEKMMRFSDGKGNLKTDGQNIISAMKLDHQPFFLKLDTDLVWSFEFVH